MNSARYSKQKKGGKVVKDSEENEFDAQCSDGEEYEHTLGNEMAKQKLVEDVGSKLGAASKSKAKKTSPENPVPVSPINYLC